MSDKRTASVKNAGFILSPKGGGPNSFDHIPAVMAFYEGVGSSNGDNPSSPGKPGGRQDEEEKGGAGTMHEGLP